MILIAFQTADEDKFNQGGTIKFLVDLLGIDRKTEVERLICEEVNDSVMDYMMAGIEIISGKRGHQYFGVRNPP